MHERSFPGVDDHIVRPETREEMVRGELILAQPAKPPHADCHITLGQLTATYVAPGYIASADLLTRFGPRSNFATDVCVRKKGTDPESGNRYLEELAFEIVNEQSLRHITVRAEDIAARGVRRLIVIFIKRGTVTEWSPAEHRFVPLSLDGVLEDPTLAHPIPIRAMLDAAVAKRAVTVAMWAQDDDPWLLERKQELSQRGVERGLERGREEGLARGLEQGLAQGLEQGLEQGLAQGLAQGLEQGRAQGCAQGLQASLLVILEAHGLRPSDEQRAIIESCSDPERLQRWLRATVHVGSVAELLEAPPRSPS